MKRVFAAMMIVGMALLAGCGGSFEWFPSNGGGGPSPTPAPSSGSLTDQQADTEVSFTKYTVKGLADATTTTSISVIGDASTTYIKNTEAPTKVAGTVKNDDTVIVQHKTSNYKLNQITSYLYVGGTKTLYTSTTGTFCFPTKTYQNPNVEISSDSAIVPASLSNGFTAPATIAIDAANTDSTSPKIFFNAVEQSDGAEITTGTNLILKHTTGASGVTVTTTAILTPKNGTTQYKVTFKSTSK